MTKQDVIRKFPGAVSVGLSADWCNSAYRIAGNADAGTVVCENDSGEWELIKYTHDEDGNREETFISFLSISR